MARPNIVILVTGDPVPEVQASRGDYAAIIAMAIGDAHSGSYVRVDARTDPLPALGPDDAVVISGSSANVHQREPWMLRAEAWLRDLVDRQVPVLGVCFGHQLLAQALGGEVRPNPKGREIGTGPVDRLADDELFAGLAPRFVANHCHSDTVTALPPGAVVIARSSGDAHQALRFNERCYGVQFHPEFDRDIIRGFLEARREAMTAEGLDADALRDAARDTPEARRVLRNFLRLIG